MSEITIAIVVLIGGIILISYSGDKAVKHSAYLAKLLGISPLIIGVTLVSIGTDLSEIVNSIVSCALGHGDIDVGDSVGSDLTQLTLIFGLLPFFAGAFIVKRKDIAILGSCEILSLMVIFIIVEKGFITRLNAIFMVGSLVLYFIIIYGTTKESFEEKSHIIEITEVDKSKKHHISIAILGFVGVTISSFLIVESVIVLSTALNVHEYIISFFIVSIGTSLPELVVDVSALRRKDYNIAVGDIIGSCIVDSTLSIGIGQVLFPSDGVLNPPITASLAIPTIGFTIIASFIVFLLVGARKKVDKKVGAILILIYLSSYPMMLIRFSML